MNDAYDFKQLCHDTQFILKELLKNINEESFKNIQLTDKNVENKRSLERSNDLKIEECDILEKTNEENGLNKTKSISPKGKHPKIFISNYQNSLYQIWGFCIIFLLKSKPNMYFFCPCVTPESKKFLCYKFVETPFWK